MSYATTGQLKTYKLDMASGVGNTAVKMYFK